MKFCCASMLRLVNIGVLRIQEHENNDSIPKERFHMMLHANLGTFKQPIRYCPFCGKKVAIEFRNGGFYGPEAIDEGDSE